MPWLGAATLMLLVTGLVWGMAFAPEDARQGNSFRIIYLHVPAAFLALAGYFLMAAAGAVGLIWKMKLSYMVMKCAAPIGAALTFIALFTGALWGKPTWGSYWVWDARVTSMLILFFLYVGVMALKNAFHSQEAGNKASAVLALVGTVNIPIIYKSVDWWFTLHQPSTIKLTSAPTMHPDMFQPLLVMILGFYCFYALALLLSVRVEILKRERKTAWVRDIVSEHPPLKDSGIR
jgi:heme exporter protein C